MVEVKAAENPDEIRYIVRIVGKDLNGLSPVWHALLGIKGIGQRMAVMMARVFESKTGIEYDAKLGEIPDDKHKVLEDIVMHPGNYGIPSWAFNRGKDIESGKDTHLVMSELDFSLRNDLQRLREIKKKSRTVTSRLKSKISLPSANERDWQKISRKRTNCAIK